MRTFNLIALTPPGMADPSIAIAASRSGGFGVLDLEYCREQKTILPAIAKLSRYAGDGCGIKLDSRADEFLTRVSSDLPEHVSVVILTFGEPGRLREQVQSLKQKNLKIVLEVKCLEQARLGEEIGVDGLIAKGHEAGGWVGEETTFILLQRLLGSVTLPVWAHGGIGLHTAAACYAAGAAGAVLDVQLAMTRESSLPEAVKAVIARMDGSETVCLGDELDAPCRVYARPGLPAVEELRRVVKTLTQDPRPRPEILTIWHQAVQQRVGWGVPGRHIWLLGQDAGFAEPLVKRFRTVGAVLEGMRQAIDDHVRSARALRPLDEAAPLALSHATRYPIIAGPMTRVSDKAAFAAQVAEAGGLPFLALALMRAGDVRAILEETSNLLGDRPWGVGILGFVPLDLRQEQIEVIRAHRPPFALIAGGRPDQARSLEQEGIPTYLHVPSPELLRLFLQDGARRFVFEGRECGGHVGPRSSFVLWNMMIDVLLESIPASDMANCHVLFAGGIHDSLSASMVAAIAAPLVERDVRIGVLLGTSYLFTKEAVVSGAILPRFQEEAIRCDRTVLLETGPGHAIRCVSTPYAEEFKEKKRRLLQEGKSIDETRLALEDMNIGRLRIASKGITRHPRHGQDPDTPEFTMLTEEEQQIQGMYMIGQVAALRNQVCTIEELHRDVSIGSTRRLAALSESALGVTTVSSEERPCDVAVVGMACLLPKAPNLQTYWENMLNKVDAVTEVPQGRWDWRTYFDPDSKARDKVYSKWGGFLEDVPFDPIRYGMPPSSLRSIEPIQMLTLEVVRAALEDAGYLDRPFPRERTSVILGAGGGIGELGQKYCVRAALPEILETVPPDLLDKLPEWTEDSFPGILLNVIAGRVANRFDLGGVNYVVDAACASSLLAVSLAVRELEMGSSDVVIAGGAENVQNPFAYLAFSKTQALSPRGRCRTFDDTADGITISEGVGIVVLKRLADAERSGDRIYAVIKGVAGSSDGRDKSLTAPRLEGQILALKRAYAKARISPGTVGLVEAHGTGTVVGDQVEVEALKRVFGSAGAAPRSCAIGSVKSMIGHTKCTAGVAGLIKVTLALHHKVLPPTLGVQKPNTKVHFGESPLYVNSEVRPWINGTANHPRRAGVSAFGFGGTNFHAVLEEYTGDFLGSASQAASQHWPSELLLWAGSSRQELLGAIEPLERALEARAKPHLQDIAYTLWQIIKLTEGQPELRLAIVATSLDDLRQKLAWATEALRAPGHARIQDPRGIYFTETLLARRGKVAFLFPGQGSQYPNMLRELALQFSEVREQFECMDRVLAQRFQGPLSNYIYPPPAFSPEEEHAQQQALTQTNLAQPALGAAGMALFHLLQELGVQPDLVAGHSYGEYVALCAAGVFNEETLATLSEARGRCIIEEAKNDLGTMAAVHAKPERVTEALGSLENVWIANLNAPEQTVISGTRIALEEAVGRLNVQGIRARPIPVACAFHSPLVAPAQQRLAEFLSTVELAVPQLEVFSNTIAAPYPSNPQDITKLLAEHLGKPVRFADEVDAMYEAGARIFIEVGPGNVLTTLLSQILGSRSHLVLALDAPGRSGLLQLHHALGQMAAHGVPLQLDRLYQGRAVRQLDLDALVEETRERSLPPTSWLVNAGRARPLRETVAAKARIGSPTQEEATGTGKVQTPTSASPTPTAAPARTDTRADVPSLKSEPEAVRQPAELSAPMPKPLTPAQPHGTPGIPPPSSPDEEAGRVMLQFQRLMDRFLETQQQVMLRYLRGSASGANSRSEVSASTETPNVWTAPALTSLPSQPVKSSSILSYESTAANLGSPPPKPASPAEPILVEEPQPSTGSEQLTQKLLQIVSERTGYPREILDLDINIESDLGIDSIKSVEILGAFQRACFPSGQQETQDTMEQLTGVKTLRGIIDLVHRAFQNRSEIQADGTSSDQLEKAVIQPSNGTDNEAEAPRFVLTAIDAPLAAAQPTPSFTDGVFLITDDEGGVAQATVEELRRHGKLAALVRMDNGFAEVEGNVYVANLTDPVSVTKLLEKVRQQLGPIGGLIHLLPMKASAKFEEMDLSGWRERLRLEVKSLFYLAKAMVADLKKTGSSGRCLLVAGTAMGGTLASDSSVVESFFPGQGGVAGLVKTIALEWPHVQCKVVDLDPGDAPSTLAGHLLREMVAGDGQLEVGYKGSRRLVLQSRPASLDKGGPTRLAIDSSWVVLVTGGARGITAEVACELATRYRPSLMVVGRAPLPAPEESPETAELTSPPELKAALMNRMRSTGQLVTPARVEAAYSRLLQDREMRSNLSAMQRAGATVRYYQVDVRDEQAFGRLIDEIYQLYGRVDGVIHGAGIIEDKLLEDKAVDSFDRVFDTKADSAFILSQKLRPDSLKFLVFFSSVAGRFGNRGQADYAAANEVLNKLAVFLDCRWPGRVVSINWGPWEKRGMVSPELQREFARRGVALIPLALGRRRLDEEVCYGGKGAAEVIIGCFGDHP